ncbi:36221_t:CDS:10, partial [Gigaspora margarita]
MYAISVFKTRAITWFTLESHNKSVNDICITSYIYFIQEDISEKVSLAFLAISFATGAGSQIFEIINLVVSGSIIALVGPLGSGKSTIISLVLRFNDPLSAMVDEREILLSGRQKQHIAIACAIIKNPKILLLDNYAKPQRIFDEENHSIGALTNHLSLDVTHVNSADNIRIIASLTLDNLWKDITIYWTKPCAKGYLKFSNVHFYYPTRTSIPVLQDLYLEIKPGQYAALVCLSECGINFIISLIKRFYQLTNGYDTRVGGKGVQITNSLFPGALDAIAHGRTTVMIAHRLSAIQHADIMFVLKDGKVYEQ